MSLRNPEFGNTFYYDTKLVSHTTGWDDPVLINDSQRVAVQGLNVEIKELSDTQKSDFVSFLISNQGLSCTYVDHYGRTWTGFIVSDIVTVVRNRRKCGWNVSFKFEGVIS